MGELGPHLGPVVIVVSLRVDFLEGLLPRIRLMNDLVAHIVHPLKEIESVLGFGPPSLVNLACAGVTLEAVVCRDRRVATCSYLQRGN